MRVTFGAVAATTSSSIPKSSRRTSFACGAGSVAIDLPSNLNRKQVFAMYSPICIQRRPVYRYKTFGMKIFALLIAAAIATPLLAQTATPTVGLPLIPHSKTIMDALIAAGPVMILLFLLSVFSVMLVIVYLMTIR